MFPKTEFFTIKKNTTGCIRSDDPDPVLSRGLDSDPMNLNPDPQPLN